MFLGKNTSTIRQMAYAKRIWGGQGTTKQQIALECGYSPNSSRSVASHIEDTPGFNNAMSKLATESNNVAVSILHEFKNRGFNDFSNKDLIGALNAIGAAWSRFNPDAKSRRDEPGANKLRTVILQQVENQTITATEAVESQASPPTPTLQEVVEVVDTEKQYDF
jgi:hypothetical protein